MLVTPSISKISTSIASLCAYGTIARAYALDQSKHLENGISPNDYSGGYAMFCFDVMGGIGNEYIYKYWTKSTYISRFTSTSI